MGILFAIIIFAVLVIVHELGHFLAAMWLHIPLSGFKLDLLGARIEVGEKYLSYGEEWLLASAGPLISLTASILAAPLWSTSRLSIMFSCASLLLASDNNMKVIQMWMGHSSMKTTADIYAHLDMSAKNTAAVALAHLFRLDEDDEAEE